MEIPIAEMFMAKPALLSEDEESAAEIEAVGLEMAGLTRPFSSTD